MPRVASVKAACICADLISEEPLERSEEEEESQDEGRVREDLHTSLSDSNSSSGIQTQQGF